MNMKTIVSAGLRQGLRYVFTRLMLRSAALLVILLAPTVPALANLVQITVTAGVVGGQPVQQSQETIDAPGAQSLGPVSRTCLEGGCTATGFGFAGNGGSVMSFSATASSGGVGHPFAQAIADPRGADTLTFSSTAAQAGLTGTVTAQIVIEGVTVRETLIKSHVSDA